MKKIYIVFSCICLGFMGRAQMVIQAGSTVFLENGAKLVVQGDLTSAASIEGTGTVVMKGTGPQNITLNGNTVPNLEIDNPANVALSGGSARIGTNLLFTSGKLKIGNQDLVLAPAATFTGVSASKFIWTDGTGQVRKELTGDVANLVIPVGDSISVPSGNRYRPVILNSTGGSYASAVIGVRNASGASPNRPPSLVNFATTYWPVTKTGITGGTQTITAQYTEGGPTDVVGSEAKLKGYFFNGIDWSSVGASQNAADNTITAPIGAASGQVTAMNKFIGAGIRAFLQGAYNSTTGLMTDNLRQVGNVVNLLIPISDPYKNNTDYNANISFTKVDDPINDVVPSSVFNNQPIDSNNIVDWVFLELRDKAAPFSVRQTRSALVQRDGDIVDIDGKSPVTFNDIADGQYLVGVKHRNHLGIFSTSSSTVAFTERQSLSYTANVQDLRLAANPLAGTLNTNYTRATYASTGQLVNLLYAGNVNGNLNVTYNGGGNDRGVILSSELGGNQGATVPGYKRGDVNMNRSVSYNGGGNDRGFLLSTPLTGNQGATKAQANPN